MSTSAAARSSAAIAVIRTPLLAPAWASVAWLAVGCAGPDSLNIRPDNGTTATSASVTVLGDSGSEVDSAGGGPQRSPPEESTPFVLPDGCGDGVVVDGQYDCHMPLLLSDLATQLGIDDVPYKFTSWDIDGDGRFELVVSGGGKIGAFVYHDAGFTLIGDPAATHNGAVSWQYTTRFDIDGDGAQDLVKLANNAIVAWHRNLGTGGIGKQETLFDEQMLGWDYVNKVVPVDVDGDGAFEFLGMRWPLMMGVSYPNELLLHRGASAGFEVIGDPLQPYGCRSPDRYAWADLDEDGSDELVMLDHSTACNGYPLVYDPAWHGVAIFKIDQTVGMLTQLPLAAAGGRTHDELLIAEDFDGDGHIDLLVGIGGDEDAAMSGAFLIRGRGDGTFNTGERVEVRGLGEWRLRSRADLDGDGDLDWVLYAGDSVVDDIFADDPGIAMLAPGAIGRGGKRYANSRAFADYNGDGVSDYIIGWHDVADVFRWYVMISAP